MPIVVQCAGCRRRFALKKELSGRRIRCRCGEVMVVPEPIAAGLEEEDYGLSPVEQTDPLDSLLDGEALPAAPKLPATPALPKSPPGSAAEPARPTAKVRIEGAVVAKMALLPVLLIGLAMLAILLFQKAATSFKPGYPTPKGAFDAYQKALAGQDWRSQIMTLDRESQDEIAGRAAMTAIALAESMPRLRSVLDRYGVQGSYRSAQLFDATFGEAGEDTSSPEDVHDGENAYAAEARSKDTVKAATRDEAEPVASRNATAQDRNAQQYVARLQQQAQRRQRQLVSGVTDKAGFFADLMSAIEEYRKAETSVYVATRIMKQKIEMETLEAVSTAQLSKMLVQGDTASATATYRFGRNKTCASVQFRYVDGRWFLHIPGPGQADGRSFADISGLGMMLP